MNAKGALGGALRDAAQIAAELRRDYWNSFREDQGELPTADPVLGVLFQALAMQIGRVYHEAENDFPWQVLDDLMAGLGMPRPMAAPAQTVLAFSNIDRRENLHTEVEVLGSHRGEMMRFVPDVPIELAPTVLRFAGVAEAGRLHVIPGARLPTGQLWPLNTAACPAASGNVPTLLLAFSTDPTDAAHLSGLGLHFDVSSNGAHAIGAIGRSPWIIHDGDGVHRADGTLRTRAARGGVQSLQWFDNWSGADDELSARRETERALDVAMGPYGEQVFVFPTVPPSRRTRGLPPVRFREALRAIAPEAVATWADEPMVWVSIPLPAGTRSVVNGLQNVSVNTVTASNIEIFTEEMNFGRSGQVVATRPEGQRDRHLMGVLSVTGEAGSRYVSESDLSALVDAGTFRVRGNLFEFHPAKARAGRFDTFAILRILLCDGARANKMPAEAIDRIITRMNNPTVKVRNLVPTRGGADPPDYETTKARFAELLRTRERVVTAPDFEITARSYDPRVNSVEVSSISEVAGGALQAVDLVRVTVSRTQFADPEADAMRLRSGLERHFERRSVLGRRVRVSIVMSD